MRSFWPLFFAPLSLVFGRVDFWVEGSELKERFLTDKNCNQVLKADVTAISHLVMGVITFLPFASSSWLPEVFIRGILDVILRKRPLRRQAVRPHFLEAV